MWQGLGRLANVEAFMIVMNSPSPKRTFERTIRSDEMRLMVIGTLWAQGNFADAEPLRSDELASRTKARA